MVWNGKERVSIRKVIQLRARIIFQLSIIHRFCSNDFRKWKKKYIPWKLRKKCVLGSVLKKDVEKRFLSFRTTKKNNWKFYVLKYKSVLVLILDYEKNRFKIFRFFQGNVKANLTTKTFKYFNSFINMFHKFRSFLFFNEMKKRKN